MNDEKSILNKVLLVGTRRTVEKAAQLPLPAQFMAFPLLDTKALENVKFTKDSYHWLAFTSPAAVKHYCGLAYKPSVKKIAAVGSSTKKTAEQYGLTVDFVPEEYNALSFGNELSKSIPKGSSVLFPCSTLADDSLQRILEQNEVQCERVNLYAPCTLSQNKLPDFDSIAFLSGSAANALHELFGQEAIEGKKIAAIGNKTAKKVIELFGTTPLVPQVSTAEDTIKVLL